MDWQQLVALLIVAAAGALMVWGRVRRQFNFQQNTHCGCTVTAGSPPSGSIIFRARRGCRPEVRVKMR